MTPKEFADAMRAIKAKYGRDIEATHFDMDHLLLKQLRELGYGEGADVFAATDLWYA